MILGERVKKLRKSLGLTQKQFASRVPGKIGDTYIGKIERGQYPSLKLLERIGQVYNVPLGYFFGEAKKGGRKRMKIYKGKRTGEGVGGQPIVVQDNGDEYPLKHIERHSPNGFNWGYGGSGPADTALSILTDCLGMEQANVLYQLFKREFVAAWGDKFRISEAEIKDWARNQRAEIEL